RFGFFVEGGTKFWAISISSGDLTVEEKIMNVPWGTTFTDGLTKTVTYVPGTGSQMNDGSGWISDDGRFLYIGARTTGSFDIHRFEFLIPGDLNSLQSSGASDRLLNIPSASSHGSVSSGTPDGLTIYVHTGAESTINAIRLPAPN